MTSEFGIAVHALVFLNHMKTIVSSDALAKNVCTNPARIRKVMNKLKKWELVKTKEGADGGYSLLKSASQITLKSVSEALDLKFVSASWSSGDIDMDCIIASSMGIVMDEIYSNLDIICKSHLNTITIADIDKKIFK